MAAPKKETKVEAEAPAPADKYMSNKIDLFHPFQKVMMPAQRPVLVEMDSWLQSQIEAGLVSKVSC